MSRWLDFFRSRARDAELHKELDSHIEERVADLVKSGLDEATARRKVRHEFGGLGQVQEVCRDSRPSRWLDQSVRDLIHSVRSLRKRPGLTLTIILTVAFCVGVNTAVFTVVDSLLIRPLPFPQADRLISMTNQYPKAGVIDQDEGAAGDYVDREGALPAISSHALYQFVSLPVERTGNTMQMRGATVTPTLFPLLRVRPAQGRFFTERESEPGNDQAVVLTDGLRREMFGTSPALGQTLQIGGIPRLVVGVLPPEFRFVAQDVRYFVPLALSPAERQGRHGNNYRYIARLKDGATVAQARAQANALGARILDQMGAVKKLIAEAGFYVRVEPLQAWLMRGVQKNLYLLWAAAGLVLIIGVANLAGLALARAHAQIPELATRAALGASKSDIVRRATIEGLVPALLGGLIGIAAGNAALTGLDQSLLPGASEIRISGTVIAYALAGSVLAGVFGAIVSLIPLRGLELAQGIRSGPRTGSVGGARLRRVFVVAQTAIALVLMCGAVALSASLRELMEVDPGFRVEGVWAASTFLNGGADSDLVQSMERIVTGVRAIPGVELAGGSSQVPFASKYGDTVIMAEGYTMKPGESVISPIRMRVAPGYLETLALTARSGRLFDGRDTSTSRRVVIVDERLARRFWADRDPVGRRIYFPGSGTNQWLTVIGVVRSVRLENLAGTGNPNGVYYTLWSQAPTRQVSLVWRGPESTVAAVRAEFARLAPGSALFDLRSMSERRESSLSGTRLVRALSLVFAAVAVLLAALGVNGLLAFLVSQQRREIGVRLAIGCRPFQVFRHFLTHGAMLVGFGMLCGACLAFAIRPLVANQLHGLAQSPPAVLALASAMIGVAAIAAIAIPAYRASRVDPVSVLRES